MSYSIQISGTVLRPPPPLPENNKNRFIVHFPQVGLKPSKTRAAPPRCSRAVIYGRKETRTNFRIILHHFSCPHGTTALGNSDTKPDEKKKPHPGRGNKTHHTQHIAHLHRKAAARSFCAGSFLARQTAGETQFLVTSRNNNSHRKKEKKCNIRKRSRQTDWCPMSRACASFRYGQKSTPPVPGRTGAEGLTVLPKSPPRKSHTCSFACGAQKNMENV